MGDTLAVDISKFHLSISGAVEGAIEVFALRFADYIYAGRFRNLLRLEVERMQDSSAV